MIQSILEQPLWIVAIGVIAVIGLGTRWIQSGRKVLLIALGGVVLLTGLLLILERIVETDREQIEATLQQIARDIENDDVEAVVAHIHPNATPIQEQARSEFSRYRIEHVKIWSIKTKVEPKNQPPRAVVEFYVRVDGNFHRSNNADQSYARSVLVTFYKGEDGTWRVGAYEHKPFGKGFNK